MTAPEKRVSRAAAIIRQGGTVIYPTETLYALGASGLDHRAAARVAELKGRQADKPLPLIISGMDQLGQVTAWGHETFVRLTELFWPGPLSILVPAGEGLSPLVADRDGWTSVRQSSNRVARDLARASGTPIVATSANLAGETPVARLEDIDPGLSATVDLVVDVKPYPRGGLPSTVVRILGRDRVQLAREGALKAGQIQAWGFEICSG